MNFARTVFVSTLADARLRHAEFDAVLTVEDPSEDRPLRVLADGPEQLVLAFEDLDEDGPGAATEDHVAAALAFARRHAGGRLLVHCVKGQARSPALALAIVADRLGHGLDDEAVGELLIIRPDLPDNLLGPNLRVLALADDALGRGGALAGAWDRWEAAHTDERRERYRFWRRAAPTMDA